MKTTRKNTLQEIIISNTGIVRDAATMQIIGYCDAPTPRKKIQFFIFTLKGLLKELGAAASYAINR